MRDITNFVMLRRMAVIPGRSPWRSSMAPIRTLTAFYVLILAALATMVSSGPVCEPADSWPFLPAEHSGYGAVGVKPGVTTSISAAMSACVQHPTAGQHILYLLTFAYVPVLVAAFLQVLTLNVIGGQAEPFTQRLARRLGIAGWFLAAGSIGAFVVAGSARVTLLDSMVSGTGRDSFLLLLPSPLMFLPPVAAGTALVAVGRLLRKGTGMREELQGLV